MSEAVYERDKYLSNIGVEAITVTDCNEVFFVKQPCEMELVPSVSEAICACIMTSTIDD